MVCSRVEEEDEETSKCTSAGPAFGRDESELANRYH